MSERLSLTARSTLVAAFLALIVWPAAQRPTHGFVAYYTAGRLLVEEGLDARIYDEVWFRAQTEVTSGSAASDIFNVNPPTMALLALPVAWLLHGLARVVWTVLNAALLGWVLFAISNRLKLNRALFLVVIAIALMGAPTVAQFEFGQAYIVVLGLFTLIWFGLRTERDGLVGIGLALALLLKLAGAPLWLFVIFRGRWRALAWAAGISLAVVALTLPLISLDAWRAFFFEALPRAAQSPTVASTAYQSLPGFWAHLLRGDPVFNHAPIVDWPVGAALLTALDVLAIVGVTLLFARRLPLDIGFAAATVASVVIVPFAEQHQYVVMILPMMIALAHFRHVIPQWTRPLDGARERSSRGIPDTGIAEGIPRFARNDVIRKGLLVLALALIALPLPYQSPQFAIGWLALLAYPRLYGALLLWGLLVFQNEFGISRTIAHLNRPQATHQNSGH